MKKERILPIIFIVVIAIFLFLIYIKRNFINDEVGNAAVTSSVASATAKLPINEKNLTETNTVDFTGAGENYGSFLDFPYDNMSFVNDDVYAILKEEYYKIDFFSEFMPGDLDLYMLYQETFKQFLDKEKFYIDKMGNEVFINEMKTDGYGKVFDNYNVNELKYYFFDIDEDGSPELTINNWRKGGLYVFKYLPEKDQVVLWTVEQGNGLYLFGSRTFSNNREGIRPMFYKLDKNGEMEFVAGGFIREDFNKRIGQAETVYMIELPIYMDADRQIEITEDMQKQAYIDIGWIGIWRYCYRVTEEQYCELMDNYYKASELADENIKAVSYSYEELFEK